jgi:hypothetical protein
MASRIVVVSGPLWDGEAAVAVDQWLEATRKKVADEGVLMLKAFPMDKTGRARGGFEARIRRVTRGQVEAIPGPTKTGVVWTPWLEGTSRRNDTTRFKGYHLFRKTRLRLARNWRKDAQAELERYIGRMGGHIG